MFANTMTVSAVVIRSTNVKLNRVQFKAWLITKYLKL